MRKETIGIIPAAIGLGGPCPEASLGPKALLDAGLADRLKGLGLSIAEYSPAEELPAKEGSLDGDCKNFTELKPAFESLYQSVTTSLEKGDLPLVVGGDHSLTIGSSKAAIDFLKAKHGPETSIGLLWVDAHPDLNTPESSPSGNIHGMSVATLIGEGHPELTALNGSSNFLTADSIVYVGLRDVDQPEREAIKNSGILSFTMREVDQLGIGEVCAKALKHLSQFDHVIVSFDLDVIDPRYAPAVATPVRGGFTFRESHYVLELVAELENLAMIELVEFNPTLDKSDTTLQVALDLIESALGRTVL